MKNHLAQCLSWITLFTLIIILLSGCECINVSCEDDINFKVIDKLTKQDLVFGTNPKYKVDSIFFKQRPDTSLTTGFYSGVTVYNQNSLISNRIPFDTIYLRLNHQDIDTLIIFRQNGKSTRCCPTGYARITAVIFNGIYAKTEGNNFLFEK